MGNLLSWLCERTHMIPSAIDDQAAGLDRKELEERERDAREFDRADATIHRFFKNSKYVNRLMLALKAAAMWRGIVELTQAPSATIRVFNDRGEEAFRSPVRAEDVGNRHMLVSTEPVPDEIRSSKYEVRNGSGDRAYVAMTTGVTPAGSPFRVEFRID
ncbi:MAG: hypothetical protein ACJ72N_07310 [Labedaea sp.]|jgi:hypothetical protein